MSANLDDRFVGPSEHDARDHTSIQAAVEIQNAGAPLPNSPHTKLNFPAGGVADAGGGVATISKTGPTGPQGPQGVPGPTGPTGPAGPGFTFEGPYQNSSVAAFPARSGSVVFTFGFTVKMYQVTVSRTPETGVFTSDLVYVTSVSKSGTQVTVNYTTVDYATNDGMLFNIGCTAAG